MAPTIAISSRLLAASLMALCLLFASASVGARAAEPLPDYVIEKFGQPPAIPQGALSEDLQRAVRVAFIDSMVNKVWGRDQSVALTEIAASKDPRLVWIISDLMRFASGQGLNQELANAAAKLLAIDSHRVQR